MAVEVRIPTILRTYTGGRSGRGQRRQPEGLIDDLEPHPGIKDRLIEDQEGSVTCTASSTSTSTTRTSASSAGSTPRSRTATRSSSSRPSPAAD